MVGTINLHKIFLGLQEQMVSKLTTNRINIIHPGTKGDASELCWLDMLNTYLPVRYRAAKAFVLDSEGQLSDQIDIVIFDRQYSPFLFNQDNALYIPAESVYAAIEVKQEINKEWIEDAGDKIASVRRLKRTSVSIPHAGGNFPPKEPFEILSGLVALDCTWNPPFRDGFYKIINSLPREKRLYLGCALQHGSFDIKYIDNTKPTIEICKPKESLIFFFLRLLGRLQLLGTVPALDIGAYAKSLYRLH